MFPLISFDLIDDALANEKLAAWGHRIGTCERPFGRHSFGLSLEGQLVSVAISASTVNETCAGYKRQECVELARLCSHPDHRDMTRPALRLWRKVAPAAWARAYWPVRVAVSYQNAVMHKGDIYRMDWWIRARFVRGGKTGPNASWSRSKEYDPKVIWCWPLDTEEREALRAKVRTQEQEKTR
jgi:antitoxin VapB